MTESRPDVIRDLAKKKTKMSFSVEPQIETKNVSIIAIDTSTCEVQKLN